MALAAAENARAAAIRARRGRPGYIKGIDRDDGVRYWGERFRAEGETFSGEAYFPDGRSYRGEFRAADSRTLVAHGYGVMVFPSGNRYEGRFQDYRPVGTGVRVDADAREWFGEVKDGRFTALGRLGEQP